MIGTVKTTAVYKPLDWQVPAFRDKSPLVLLSGSAGGGKSRLAAEKVHAYAKKYPGATCLIVRKTEDSMKNSTLPFFRKVIIGEELGHGVRHIESKSRFEYANGSIVAYGGMLGEREREAVRGIGQDGGLDFVWMEEATRFEELDYNELLARMRGKAGPWRQILMSTNPDAPNHWINRRLIIGGEASVYYSGAKDNPHNPPEYVTSLDRLTGILFDRLVGGKWVQAEGVVYDNFSMENVTTDAEYNPDLPVIWGVDDGYTYGQGVGTMSYHPRVILLGQVTARGGINVFAEYGKTQELSEDSIKHVLELPYPKPEIAYIDSSAAELKARLHAVDIPTVNATHRVAEGIKNVRRLMCDGAGVRLLQIHPRCAEFIREIQSYRYDDKSNVSDNGERKPLKLDDHYCFVAGTTVHLKRGIVSIETVLPGDYALTRNGYKRVNDAGMTASAAQTYTITLSDGRALQGTGNHPVWVFGKGYIELQNLLIGDRITDSVFYTCKGRSWFRKQFNQKKSHLTGLSSAAIQTVKITQTGITSVLMRGTLGAALGRFMLKSGKRSMEIFQRVTTSIMQTATQATTILIILYAYLLSTIGSITPRLSHQSARPNYAPAWIMSDTLPLHGIAHRKAANGIVNTVKTLWQTVNLLPITATNAGKFINPPSAETALSSVPTTANPHGVGRRASIISNVIARFVTLFLSSTSTANSKRVVSHAGESSSTFGKDSLPRVTSVCLATIQPVYNLTIEDVPEYFANGILVHNCDSARYMSRAVWYGGE